MPQVEQYMQSLPEEYRPVKGGPGETYRAQQFIHQLPPHDLSPDKCHQLSDLEKRYMGKFTERRTNKSYGVGVIEQEADLEKVCST